jgi:cell division protein FtsL
MPYKKIFFFIIIILLVLTINNLIHSIYSTWQKQDLIVKAQKDLEKAQEENQKLKQSLAQVKKPEFVETEARDKLFLAKPGEGIVVIPTTGLVPSPSVPPPPKDLRPNWQRWWETFF